MNDYLLIAGYSDLGCGALGVLLVLPLLLGLVRRNRFYGVRSRRTLSSRAIWRQVNRAAGVPLLLLALAAAGIGWGLFYAIGLKLPEQRFAWLWIVPLGLVGPWALHTLIRKLLLTRELRYDKGAKKRVYVAPGQ